MVGEFEQQVARASQNPDDVVTILNKYGLTTLGAYIEALATHAKMVQIGAYRSDVDAQQNSVNQLTPAQQADFDAQQSSINQLTPAQQADFDAQQNSANDVMGQMDSIDMQRTQNLEDRYGGVFVHIRKMLSSIGDGAMDAIRKGLEMAKGMLNNANANLGQMVPGTNFSYAALLAVSLIASIVGFALYKVVKFIRNRRQEATAEGLSKTYTGLRNALREGVEVNEALMEMSIRENFGTDAMAAIAERAQNVGHALANFVVGESSNDESWFKKAFRVAGKFIVLCGLVAIGIFAFNKYEAFASEKRMMGMDKLDLERQGNAIDRQYAGVDNIDMARIDNMKAADLYARAPQMDQLDLDRQNRVFNQNIPNMMAQADKLDQQRNLNAAMRANRS